MSEEKRIIKIDTYIIKTQRLGLRHWQDSDYLPFSQINGDPQVMEFFPKVLTEDESNSMVDKLKNHFEKHRFGAYAVEDIVTKEFIGCIGLNIPDFEADFTPCVEILWRIGTKFWGKGYATEAAKACLEYAFEKLDFEEIVSFTSIFNKRSERVMQKIGMKKQGEFMHPKLPEDHRLCRHVLYKISKSEFLGNRIVIDKDTYLRRTTEEDSDLVRALMNEYWGGEPLVVNCKNYYPSKLDGMLLFKNDNVMGFLFYDVQGTEYEIIVFEIFEKFSGFGTIILNEFIKIAKSQNCTKIHLMTTNDNLDALRFYQRRGFIIKGIRLNVLEESRKMKPSIPDIGDYGIPLRDEIEFELPLKNKECDGCSEGYK